MRNHAAVLAVAFAFVLSAASIAQAKPGGGGGGSAAGPFEFAGFTTVTTTGDAGGPPGMHQLCQDDFGAEFGDENVRTCTTREWALSPLADTPPEAVSPAAWIIPELVGGRSHTANDDARTAVFGIDNNQTNCRAWTTDSTSNSGTVIEFFGRIGVRGCQQELLVTCCARR